MCHKAACTMLKNMLPNANVLINFIISIVWFSREASIYMFFLWLVKWSRIFVYWKRIDCTYQSFFDYKYSWVILRGRGRTSRRFFRKQHSSVSKFILNRKWTNSILTFMYILYTCQLAENLSFWRSKLRTQNKPY